MTKDMENQLKRMEEMYLLALNKKVNRYARIVHVVPIFHLCAYFSEYFHGAGITSWRK